MELEHLVDKIAREVIESINNKSSQTKAMEMPSAVSYHSSINIPGPGDAVILACSSNLDSNAFRELISTLHTRNIHVSTVMVPQSAPITLDGVKAIRCDSVADTTAAVRNAGKVIILMNDIATISRIANLTADRYDIESLLLAIESGKEVWGIRTLAKLPAPIENKINQFIREIESYGIKIMDLGIRTNSMSPVSVITTATSITSSTCSCPANSGNECSSCGLCANLNVDQVRNIVDTGAERVSAAPGVSLVSSEIAGMIDHTLLKPDATREQVMKLCEEARQYKFASCCVNPTWVRTVAENLKGSPVKTCVVIGFPLGANSSVIKAMETRDSIAAGADEVDMVINVGALKAGDNDHVLKDIKSVVDAAQGRIVKVILETALLSDEEKVRACELAKQAGADFVKTSTGFGPGGATAKDVALMRKTVGKYMGVKASGGIRDFATANEMVQAGATRIGASASVGIVKGAKAAPGGGY
jgi:deoxyribose-phosphate aldolase